MYLTVSFWILMFSCARRTARSKMLRCCCRCSRSLFGFCRAFCCAHQAAANAAPVAAALKMCSYMLSQNSYSLSRSLGHAPLPCILFLCVSERARLRMYVSVCRVHMHAHIFTAICMSVCACLCFIFYLFSLMRQRNAIKTRPV